MKARIRKKLLQREAELYGSSESGVSPVATDEQYFTPKEVAEKLRLHPDTIKSLFQNETAGVIRIGNRASTRYKRRYVVERYSASAIERLIRRLEYRDPRYSGG